MARAPRPEDLYDLRVPTDLELSPDGRLVAFSVKAVAPGKDGYRSSLWLAPADGSVSGPTAHCRQSRNDTTPRWSPDGRTLAFLSDRAAVLQAGGGGAKAGKAEAPKEGGTQVWLLPFADGGEARQLTDLPKDVEGMDWSPDGRRLAVVSTADSAEPEKKPDRKPEDGPAPDTRLIDTLGYQFNGAGFVHERFTRIWPVDATSGEAELLTRGNHHDADPQWSPDGRQIAFVVGPPPESRTSAGAATSTSSMSRSKRIRQLSPGRGRQQWGAAAWSPDGRWLSAIGQRDWRRGELQQSSVWRIRARDGHAENLIPDADLEAAAGMNSDLMAASIGRPRWMADGRWVAFAAPSEGSFELWRVEVDGGRIERLTRDRHYLARPTISCRCRAVAPGWPPCAPPPPARWRSSSATSRLAGFRAAIGSSLPRSATSMGERGPRSSSSPRSSAGTRSTDAESRAGSSRHPRTTKRNPAPVVLADPRWAGDALRLVADVGVAATRRVRDQRLRVQPARIARLRPGLPERQRPRLGRWTDARRHGRPRLADRGRPRRRRPHGRHRRLVWRVPHVVDRRPHRSVQGGGHLPVGQRHDQPDALGRHRRTRTSG